MICSAGCDKHQNRVVGGAVICTQKKNFFKISKKKSLSIVVKNFTDSDETLVQPIVGVCIYHKFDYPKSLWSFDATVNGFEDDVNHEGSI